MAYYPYAGIVRDAFNASQSSVDFLALPIAEQRRLHDIATDIVLRGGATTPFEKKVQEIVDARKASGQDLEDRAVTIVAAPPPQAPSPSETEAEPEAEVASELAVPKKRGKK